MSTTNDQRAFDAALRTDFLTFVHRCIKTINPGIDFLENWHHRAISFQLMQMFYQKNTRLIINMPPRSLKSIMISVAFPAFVLGHHPSRKIFCISYGAELAEKHAQDFRSIVESAWYRRAFPKMQIARAADSDIYTQSRGFRKSTSINATLTGLGGDCFIIDDPIKPGDAISEPIRKQVNEWFSHTLSSRLDDKRRGQIILTQQRLHVDDLTGHLLSRSSDWTHLSLAAIAETDERIQTGPNRFYRRMAGKPLHPSREPLSILEKLKREIGSDLFSAQYQQTPVPPGGAMIQRSWLRYYHVLPEKNYKNKIIQSWDTAAKSGAHNDWCVCTTWLIEDRKRYYLIDLTRGRYEYPELKRTAISLAERFKPRKILIEDASTGTALAQELRQAALHPVALVPVDRDKIGRLYVQQAKFEAGLVLFPADAPFLETLESELLAFPQARTDDQVDSISQALAYKTSGHDPTYSWVY